MQFSDNPWDLFPDHEHLGTEECGNEILVDATVPARPVVALWHDPPLVMLLCRTAAEFRELAPDFDQTQTLPRQLTALVDTMWARGDAHMLPLNKAGEQLGPAFASWLAPLPPSSLIADLRAGVPGAGFIYDLRSQFTRCPGTLVFARATTPRPPGLVRRLFG
jgi:hypothetical protein